MSQAFVSNPPASHTLMLRQLVLVISADGGWRPVSGPLSPTRLLLFTPSFTFLSGTAFPFGLPPGVSHVFPLSVDDQRETEAWQLQSHQRLEQELQEFPGEFRESGEGIHGYVTLSLDRQKGQAPLVIQELPETVGGKVWRGAWLLWKSLEVYGLQGASTILEVGAGVGLVGLLLAADYGLKVTLSETKTAYSSAVVTWENLVKNIDVNREKIMEAGGHVEALELDWSQGFTSDSKSFDLVIGSDILYEPHLFQDLLNVMQEAAPKAVLFKIWLVKDWLFLGLVWEEADPSNCCGCFSSGCRWTMDGRGCRCQGWCLPLLVFGFQQSPAEKQSQSVIWRSATLLELVCLASKVVARLTSRIDFCAKMLILNSCLMLSSRGGAKSDECKMNAK